MSHSRQLKKCGCKYVCAGIIECTACAAGTYASGKGDSPTSTQMAHCQVIASMHTFSSSCSLIIVPPSLPMISTSGWNPLWLKVLLTGVKFSTYCFVRAGSFKCIQCAAGNYASGQGEYPSLTWIIAWLAWKTSWVSRVQLRADITHHLISMLLV